MTAALSLNVINSEKHLPVSQSAPALDVRVESPLLVPNWDEWVLRQPQASIFHTSAWLRVLSDTYGFSPLCFTATGKGDIGTAIPMIEVRSWLTGVRGISLPFTDECEPLGDSEELVSAAVKETLRTGKSRGWRRAEFRGTKKMFNGAKPSLAFLGHRLDLSQGNSLFNRFDGAVKRAIRKSEKAGLNVEFSDELQAVREFYALHCSTRRRHGLPPQPFRFFQQIHRHIIAQKRGVVVTAKLKGHAVASAMFFFTQREAVYKFGASDRFMQTMRANNLVMWQAIQWLVAKGVKTLRLGRTSMGNEGLRRFKLGWGTEEYAINYYSYDLRGDALIAQKDEASGFYNSIFRTSPVFLNRLAGAFLYKHVA